MKLSFNSIPVFCISLLRSKERRSLVNNEFIRAGINYEFFDAVDREQIITPELCVKGNPTAIHPQAPGIYACMMSHRELFKKASKLKLPAICVFEDDVRIAEDFKERMAFIESLDIDFDMLLLGGHVENSIAKKLINTDHPHMFQINELSGSYGYIITRPVYEFCIRNLNYTYGMDEFLSEVVYKRFNCQAFLPFMVGCRPCKSEITGAYSEYKNIETHTNLFKINIGSGYFCPVIHKMNQDRIDADNFRENTLRNEKN